MSLSTTVPQDSVAGPGTFRAYTQSIGMLARHHGNNLHLYADDTQLYLGCHQEDLKAFKEQLESCVAEIRR